MPKNGNSAEKKAARDVQEYLGVTYTTALRVVREHKREDNNWSQAAEAAISAHK